MVFRPSASDRIPLPVSAKYLAFASLSSGDRTSIWPTGTLRVL